MRSIAGSYRILIRVAESVLAVAVLGGVLVYGVASAGAFWRMDWSASATFYELIYRVLLLVIGLELVRMLITHELRAVLELLAFVIARKMLKPELSSADIALGALAFVALLAARRWGWDEEAASPAGPDRGSAPGE